MCKSDIFFKLLSLTEQETEVPRNRILGDCKDMESTDARYILVTFLFVFDSYSISLRATMQS